MLTPFLLLLALEAPPSVQVRLGEDPLRVEVRAQLAGRLLNDIPEGKLSQEQGERWLRFCLIDPDTTGEGPAILGNYHREKSTLIFSPRHPLSPGHRYRALLETGGGKRVSVEHQAPAVARTPPPEVERIYPTGDVLPANLLKFYLHFSKPMRESKAIFDQIQLLDERGKPVHDPWRRTELWSADGRRLTLWIHPGRIKTGVAPRETEGPVLRPNQRYTLVLGADIRDATGQTLGKAFKKEFRTSADDRARPLPEKWKLTAPAARTRQPLVIEFPEPLDRALLDRFLAVQDIRGQSIAGRIEVGKEERTWLFHPARDWGDFLHILTIDGDLEDLAGNTPERLFDVDLDAVKPPPPTLTLQFRPRSQG